MTHINTDTISKLSDSHRVLEFTEQSQNVKCPDKPTVMSLEDVKFITRMVFSEIDELVSTVTKNMEERDALLQECLDTRDRCKNHHDDYDDDVKTIGAQADSMVDAYYYMLNMACKRGMNISRLFDIVHQANMDKRDPKTGKFIRRESDGKVMKPPGWKPADVEGEIQRQLEHGSWN